MVIVHISRDRPTNKACKYHCTPSCHPANTLEEKEIYGCTHPVWRDYYDFTRIVDCEGNPDKCEIDLLELTTDEEEEIQSFKIGIKLNKKIIH